MNFKPTILIVDDLESNGKSFEELLTADLDVDIHRATSGKKALDMLDKHSYAVVLLDIQMPEMDGFEVFEQLRTNPSYELLPVIFISAVFTEKSYRLKGVRSGLVDFLEKPIVPEVLLGKVTTYVRIFEQHQKLIKHSEFHADFLAKMSHEIRTPMNSILGMADLLSELELPGDGKEWIHVLQKAGENLLSIIDDILDISKIESGKLLMKKEEFPLEVHMQSLVILLSKKAEACGTKIHMDFAPNVPKEVVGDKVRLWQIVNNLIGNAIKFTKEGTIDFRVCKERISDKDMLHFVIEDTGIGIPREHLPHIFERYTQLDPKINQRYGGTGLGLQITNELVRMMSGDIWVESSVGVGTSFHFTIPLIVASKSQRKKILIVEDEIDIRMLLDLELSSKYNTISVENGQDALEIVKSEKVDLVLSDINTPLLDGVELVTRLRDQGNDIPVILMSGESEKYLKNKLIKLEGIDLLAKPLNPKELETLIEVHLEKRSLPKIREIEIGELKILIVDDSSDNQLLMKAYLKDTHHQIEFASNGKEALERIDQSKFDLVLMDTNMPVMDGNTATKKVRELGYSNRAGKRLPIIALTAYATEKERARGMAAGHDSYLTKPIKKKALLDEIKSVISKLL